MFRGGQYDVIDIPLAAAGMNQNIAPESLDTSQAYWLENIIPIPLGNGRVRYGTKVLPGLEEMPSTWRIQEMFNYTTTNNEEQLLLYIEKYIHDDAIEGLAIDNNNAAITFTSSNYEKYIASTRIEIEFELEGYEAVSLVIKNTKIIGHTVALFFYKQQFIYNMKIKRISYASGSLYLYNVTQATFFLDSPLKENLAVHSVPRSALFESKLLICNGVDHIMKWDGTSLEDLLIWAPLITDKTLLERIDDHNFAFSITMHFKKETFSKGCLICIKLDGKPTDLTIVNLSINSTTNRVTITTVEPLPPWETQTSQKDDSEKVQLYYQDYPPKFSYIKVMNNRVWGLGEGPVGLNYRKESLKVYFSYEAASLTHWCNDTTKMMPYIDMYYEHGRYDSFEAMEAIGNNIIFIGRHKTQIWQGTDPRNPSNFVWKSTVMGGTIHGNLVTFIGNDLFFISPQGLMSFSTLNAAKQFAVSALDAMNPFIRRCVQRIMVAEEKYRQCRSFYYTRGSFVGFQIGMHETIIGMVTSTIQSFSVFSGSFRDAHTFSTSGEKLFLSMDNKLLQYNDHGYNEDAYVDDGKPINFIWTLPVINLEGRKYACKWFEINAKYSSSFAIQNKDAVTITVSGDLRKSFNIDSNYNMAFHGDVLGQIPLASTTAPDAEGIRLELPYSVSKIRLKFVASSFWCTLHGAIKTGDFIIQGLRLYGRSEPTPYIPPK